MNHFIYLIILPQNRFFFIPTNVCLLDSGPYIIFYLIIHSSHKKWNSWYYWQFDNIFTLITFSPRSKTDCRRPTTRCARPSSKCRSQNRPWTPWGSLWRPLSSRFCRRLSRIRLPPSSFRPSRGRRSTSSPRSPRPSTKAARTTRDSWSNIWENRLFLGSSWNKQFFSL